MTFVEIGKFADLKWHIENLELKCWKKQNGGPEVFLYTTHKQLSLSEIIICFSKIFDTKF